MNWTNISLGKYNQIKEIFLDPDFTEEDRLIRFCLESMLSN